MLLEGCIVMNGAYNAVFVAYIAVSGAYIMMTVGYILAFDAKKLFVIANL